MSMIGCFYALKDNDLEEIVQEPKRIHSLWSKPQPSKEPSFLPRLFGTKKKARNEPQGWQPSPETTSFDVDKAWQGIHFLLTNSAWEGSGPLAFIIHGGREIAEEMGYGPPHGFTSTEVKAINTALQSVNLETLYERADPAEFTKNDIYPSIWDREPKEESIGYLMEHLKALKIFVAEVAQSNRAMIVVLS